MAVADIFEALTAADRPYKQSKPLSKTLLIMRQMCEDGHIVLELLTTFCAYWYHI
jgi:HD-GYP domain-containing protein (c-di-GMP phosphodiesterase class II)